MGAGILAYAVAALSGLLMPMQAAVNSRLRGWTGLPLVAPLLSFSVSRAMLLILMTAVGAPMGVDLLAGLPWWMFLGGVCGVTVLTGNILMITRLGAVLIVVLPAAGQIAMGLIIDAFGLFEATQINLTFARAAGAILAAAGVVLASMYKSEASSGKAKASGGASLWLWRAFAVLAGALGSMQTAVNGRLGTVVGSPVSAAVVSFTVGFVLLAIISLCSVAVLRARHIPIRHEKGVWWMWLGGPMGATMVLLNAALAPIIGTGSVAVLFLAGSAVAGAIIDQAGLFGAEKRPLGAMRIAGLIMLIAGAALVRLS